MINGDSKKLSCFPVILFYQNTFSHFYDMVIFSPNSASLTPSSNVYPKSCWTPCEAIYIPLSLKLFLSQIQSLNSLGKFLWVTAPGTIIP